MNNNEELWLPAVDRYMKDMCEEIDSLRCQVSILKMERDKYEKDYFALLDSSIKHSQNMMGNVLKLCLHSTEETINKAFCKEEK